ncbi:MAG: asparagine synthetase B family protein [Anaerolineales bacterium]
MPGLVGFIGTPPVGNEKRHLDAMMQALEPDNGFHRDTFFAPGVGLGRVTLGILNPQNQPVWNTEQARCILFEGELYETERLQRLLAEHVPAADIDGDASLLLALYDAMGEACLPELNGAFIAAIWDSRARELVLFNDRMGQYPLYYAKHHDRFLFASGVRALLADPELPRRTDRLAIAQFLTFDHMLHDRTLLESVKLMRQASIMRVRATGEIQCRDYFDFQYPPVYALISEQDYIDEFLRLMEQAVARQSQHSDPIGILLSGGMDSRVLLTYLARHTNQPAVHSFTWGTTDSDDVRFAQEVAAKLGTEHHYFPLKPDWLQHHALEAVRLTDGMGNLVNLHALATLNEETQYARVIHKGFMGDAMFGFALRQQFWANYDQATLPAAHLQVHADQGVITFNEAERMQLFTPEFQREVQNGVLDEYMAGMYESGSEIPADQRLYFDYRQRVHRMTVKGVEVVRSQAMVRLPFCDNDLLEFALRVPPGLRYERRIVHNAFIQAFPKLAQIPVTPSGLPMVNCAREIRIRTERLFRWHLIHRGLLKGPYTERHPYANYPHWFRTNLRDWVTQTLLSEKALARGYYNPDYLRKTIQAHMDGANSAVRLGAFMAIELWHQLYLD